MLIRALLQCLLTLCFIVHDVRAITCLATSYAVNSTTCLPYSSCAGNGFYISVNGTTSTDLVCSTCGAFSFANTNPLVITDSLLWLDAADPQGTGTIPESGSVQTTWIDKSANKYNATQGYAVYVQNTLNGLGVFRFSTSTNIFLSNVSNFSGNAFTTFAVQYASANSGHMRFLNGVPDYRIFLGTLNGNVATFAGNAVGSWSDTNQNLPAVSNYLNWRIVTTVVSGTVLTPYSDNVAMNAKSSSVPIIGTLSVGGLSNTNQHWIGDIAEILVYSRALNTAERVSVEAYLSNKWALLGTSPKVCYACTPWSCGSGTYIRVNGTAKSPGYCSACPAGTYSSLTNVYSCINYTTVCQPGMYITTNSTTSTDRACATCSLGTYSSVPNTVACASCSEGFFTNSNSSATGCQVSTSCESDGIYISANLTSSSNRQCSPCPANTTKANKALDFLESLSSLWLWLDGNDPGGTGQSFADGTSLTVWKDKSRKAFDASWSALSQPARVKNNIKNGNSVVRFARSLFSIPISPFPYAAHTIVSVQWLDPVLTTNDHQRLLASYNDAYVYHGFFNGAFTSYMGSGGTWNQPCCSGSTPAVSNVGSFRIFTRVLSSSILSTYYDGTPLNPITGSTGAFSNLVLGTFTDPNTLQAFYGDLAELIIFGGALSNADRQLVEGKLAFKWGISGPNLVIPPPVESSYQCQPFPTCPPGFFISRNGTAVVVKVCTGCPVGKFSVANDSITCSTCPAFTFTNVTNTTTCIPWDVCPRNTYVFVNGSTNVSQVCRACPTNTYAAQNNSFACVFCQPVNHSIPHTTSTHHPHPHSLSNV